MLTGFQALSAEKISCSDKKIAPPPARKSECPPPLFTFLPLFREPPKDVFTRYGSTSKFIAT
jgi:hypothetical protein